MTFARRESAEGAAAVEMAVIMPLLVMLLFGMVAFGIQLYRTQSMQAAVREGGRFAAVGESYTEIAARVFQEQGLTSDISDLVIEVRRGATTFSGSDVPCGPNDVGDLVTVTAEVASAVSFALYVPIYGPVDPNFNSVAVFRCE